MPNGETKAVPVPKIFPAQRELIHWLESQGVTVWGVSASLEEVVRMVVSDPKYGLSIPPERVIGVNLMMYKPDGQTAVGAIERSEDCTGLDHYFSPERMRWTLSDYPYAPLTWYAGKVAGIKEWIHPSQRPLLVAGDSPNDFYMQFYSDVENDGIRLRVHLNDGHKQKLIEAQKMRMISNADGDPTKGWLVVTPKELGVEH